MKEIKKEIIVYVVGDKEFVDKKQAEEYKKKLEKELSYWRKIRKKLKYFKKSIDLFLHSGII